MHLFNLCELKYVLYWEHLISFAFTIRTGRKLVGNSITVKLVYPKIVRYQNPDFSYLWDDYKKSGDSDDIPF